MKDRRMEVMVFCTNTGLLLNYSRLLNAIGYFSVSLCSSMQEVLHTLERGLQFDYFIFDNFKCKGHDRHALLSLSAEPAIGKFLLVSEMTFKQRRDFSQWVEGHGVPLLNVLQQPVREAELAGVMHACHAPGIGAETHASRNDVANRRVPASQALSD